MADPALEGCLPISARSQTYPCTHKAQPAHSRARSTRSCLGKPQLPFPLQKRCKIFSPWKHFLPTQGIFRLMVHQTSVQETLVWPTSVWVWERVGEKTLLGISPSHSVCTTGSGLSWEPPEIRQKPSRQGKNISSASFRYRECSSIPFKSSFHIPLFFREC